MKIEPGIIQALSKTAAEWTSIKEGIPFLSYIIVIILLIITANIY